MSLPWHTAVPRSVNESRISARIKMSHRTVISWNYRANNLEFPFVLRKLESLPPRGLQNGSYLQKTRGHSFVTSEYYTYIARMKLEETRYVESPWCHDDTLSHVCVRNYRVCLTHGKNNFVIDEWTPGQVNKYFNVINFSFCCDIHRSKKGFHPVFL